MDGDTWSAHRLVVDGDGSPPFLMEPHNPPHLPAAFEAAGFDVVAKYVSNATSSATLPDVALASGVTVRRFDGARAQRDLPRLYCLCMRAFAANAFYRPISEERFLAAYGPLASALNSELSFLAEDERGDLVGFLFGYPNYAEGPKPRTAVVKTAASTSKGVGAMLVRAAHEAAARQGYSRVIHALMHEANPSVRLSHRFGASPFRHYSLWGKRL
jgi:predicted N-acetyltransferase YhbS